jgi:membrane protein DedA with SNARE-associated domain
MRGKVASASRMLERHGTLFVLSFRFLYGIRNIASAACGIAGMPWPRFAVLNFIGAGIWAASFVAAGWFIGGLLGPETLGYAIATIGLTALAFFVGRHYLRKRAAPGGGDGGLNAAGAFKPGAPRRYPLPARRLRRVHATGTRPCA